MPAGVPAAAIALSCGFASASLSFFALFCLSMAARAAMLKQKSAKKLKLALAKPHESAIAAAGTPAGIPPLLDLLLRLKRPRQTRSTPPCRRSQKRRCQSDFPWAQAIQSRVSNRPSPRRLSLTSHLRHPASSSAT